jgi:PHD/YefM family antitoxin component YafN of YafNO toxin-antitoxin module
MCTRSPHLQSQSGLLLLASYLYIMLYNMKYSISDARARLPELAQLVMESPGKKVIIEHRNREERIVLIAESHVRALEEMVNKLREMNGAAPFKLVGSITSDLSEAELEAALTEMRAAEAATAAARLDGMGA